MEKTQHHRLLKKGFHPLLSVHEMHGQEIYMEEKHLLAIETSCDETAASVIKFSETEEDFDFEILSNVVASQIDIHKKWGGVFPELASRAHLEAMIPVLEEALPENKLEDIQDLDALAITQGPGLIGSLLMGNETANILAGHFKKPLIAINHIEGHIYTTFADNDRFQIPKSEIFPILALVVSGGHTSLILMKDHLNYETVGQTIDDAAGEAFDKVSKLMELGYPGGPIIEKMAAEGNENAYELPIAIKQSLDFSFSGLKTAVLYLTKDVKNKKALEYNRNDLSASFQKAVVDALILKTKKAIERYSPRTVILSGGVSANGYLRERFKREISDINIFIPPKKLSTDNAVGIAAAGAIRFLKNMPSSNFVEARANFPIDQT